MEINGNSNYLIYDDGRVFSKYSNKFLKHRLDGRGYNRVSLSQQKVKSDHSIHRLVALHYIPNPENKREVDHIDRNPLNNDISNLRWATRSENLQNVSKYYTNKSGHKNIIYCNNRKLCWRYKKTIRGKYVTRYFKTLTDALCFKYIRLLQKNLG